MYILVDSNNIVQNIISYNGTDHYIPATGLSLQQIPDDYDPIIGQTVPTSPPPPPAPAAPDAAPTTTTSPGS